MNKDKNFQFDRENLGLYLDEIGRYSLLTKEQEKEIGYRILKGDKKAVDELFHSNLRLAFKIAMKYYRKIYTTRMDLFDYINEANMGLYQACKRFDVRKGNAFSGYAIIYMRKYIYDALNSQMRDCHISGYTYQRLKNYKQEKESIEMSLGRDLSDNELMNHLSFSSQKVMFYQQLLADPISLNSVLTDTDGTIELMDTIPDDSIDIEQDTEKKMLLKELTLLMKSILSAKELDILQKRFGFKGKIMKYQEIADDFNQNNMHCTKQRIHVIEKNALRKLRNALNRERCSFQKVLK